MDMRQSKTNHIRTTIYTLTSFLDNKEIMMREHDFVKLAQLTGFKMYL